MEFEVYREVWRITEWRGGAVYRTEVQGSGWYDEAVVKANKPRETNLLYEVPSSSTWGVGDVPAVLIRRKRN